MVKLYQVVLEHVYLGIFLCLVGGVAMVVDDRGWTIVLVLGGMRVEDIHGALLLGLRGLCWVLLLLRLILLGELVTPYTHFEILYTHRTRRLNDSATLKCISSSCLHV